MGQSLVAFDTDHIKRYVFGTDKLKEIRGASSLLDRLNRVVMVQIAEKQYHAEKVYANGGAGLFLIKAEQHIALDKTVSQFQKDVQQEFYSLTGGGASVTSISLLIPDDKDIWNKPLENNLELLQWLLQEMKNHPPNYLASASHPFMRLCDSCGSEYADAGEKSKQVPRDPGEEDDQYCASCQEKRLRDTVVTKTITPIIKKSDANTKASDSGHLWERIIPRLRKMEYNIPEGTQRLDSFNRFRDFKGGNHYFAVVYADADNMGQSRKQYVTLSQQKEFASQVDNALHEAVCTAITQHLKIDDYQITQEQSAPNQHKPDIFFPFDILLLGGDDIYMVVPASVAMDVALTITETFHNQTDKKQTLSVGVVLAPIKYPFGLLQDMAETTLQFAKTAGADTHKQSQQSTTSTNARINFMIVTGGSSKDFKSLYKKEYYKKDKELKQEFHATLRPYTTENLHILLNTIRSKDGSNLGRTKLHQIREAVLKMNLTTGVSEGLAVLRNWREKQRNHVVRHVYEFGGRYQMPRSNPDEPASGFPRVTFPWFTDDTNEKGDDVYRTPLLDFVELYDFVSREGGDSIDEA